MWQHALSDTDTHVLAFQSVPELRAMFKTRLDALIRDPPSELDSYLTLDSHQIMFSEQQTDKRVASLSRMFQFQERPHQLGAVDAFWETGPETVLSKCENVKKISALSSSNAQSCPILVSSFSVPMAKVRVSATNPSRVVGVSFGPLAVMARQKSP